MAYTCPFLNEAQKEAVKRAREAFLSATNTSKASGDRQVYSRQVRVAMVQSLCDGMDQSDDEVDRKTKGDNVEDGSTSVPRSGEA